MRRANKRKLFENFLKKSYKAHKNTYSYKEEDYKGARTKMNITCSIHGVFKQYPMDHVQGSGCKHCTYERTRERLTIDTKEFKKRAKKIHDNKFDYSKVDYINSKTKVLIICPDHGEFKQRPNNHLLGYGCNECANEKSAKKQILSNKEFLKKVIEVHGDDYDYSKTNYTGAKNKIDIICKKHGLFSQSPGLHLKGAGCKKCADELVGWSYSKWKKAGERSKAFESFKVYIIKCWNEDEEFYKIGKTFRKIKRRFKAKKEIPYKYEVIKVFEGEAREISELEQELKTLNSSNSYIPALKFNGHTECFSLINFV